MQQWIVLIIEKIGYLGIFLMIALENIFPPIPSEVILTFGGFMTRHSNMSIVGVIAASTIGSLAGALLLYKLGGFLGINRLQKIVRKYGRILRLKPNDISKSMAWYDRYQKSTVFFLRMVPILRSLISIPAGMAKMRLDTFVLLTTFGSMIWNTVLILLGSLVGGAWQKIVWAVEIYSELTLIMLCLCALAFVVFIIIKKIPKAELAKRQLLRKSANKDEVLKRWEALDKSLQSSGNETINSMLELYGIYIKKYKKNKIQKNIKKIKYSFFYSPNFLADFEAFSNAYIAGLCTATTVDKAFRYLPQPDHKLAVTVALMTNYPQLDFLKIILLQFYYKMWVIGAAFIGQEKITKKIIEKIEQKNAPKDIEKYLNCYINNILDTKKLVNNIINLYNFDFCGALLLYLYYCQNSNSKFIADDNNLKFCFDNKKNKTLATINIRQKDLLLLDCNQTQTQRLEVLSKLFGIDLNSQG